MLNRVMVDVETCGIEPEFGKLLEVALMEMVWQKETGLYAVGKTKSFVTASKVEANEWALQNGQAGLYAEANAEAKKRPELLDLDKEYLYSGFYRSYVTEFLECIGSPGRWNLHLCGRNLVNFDLPWLYKHGILRPEDHHYRVYDITPGVQLVADVYEPFVEVKDLTKLVNKAAYQVGEKTIPEAPPGNEHRALWDCYHQARILNGLIMMCRGSVTEYTGVLNRIHEEQT